jgi:hypothetical protein
MCLRLIANLTRGLSIFAKFNKSWSRIHMTLNQKSNILSARSVMFSGNVAFNNSFAILKCSRRKIGNVLWKRRFQ